MHAQDDLNLRILRMLEGTLTLDMALSKVRGDVLLPATQYLISAVTYGAAFYYFIHIYRYL